MRSTIDFLQSSFSGFFAAKSSRMAVTSTTGAGAAAGAEAGSEVAGGAGVEGVAAATVVIGGAVVEGAGVPPLAGAAVACPNIFDMRLVNIPIRAENTPGRDKLPAHLDFRS
jgi:hypothetical protein